MRRFLIFVFLFGCSNLLFCQFQDTIIYKSEKFTIVKRFKTNRYTIRNERNGQLISDLKFINRIGLNFQVLDNNNKIYYLNENLEKSDSFNNFLALCGTVPHYELTVKSDGENFLIMEDETFYDHMNKNPTEEIARVTKAQADKVLFINGSDKFNFTENFGIGEGTTIDPRTIILCKNGKYSFLKQPGQNYDTIYFSESSGSLKTQKKNLYGYYGIVEPKYISISDFKYFLAAVTFENGKTGYIDYLGNEYR